MGLFLLTWVCSTFGFMGLATAMDKHQKQLFAVPFSAQKRNMAKIIGWGALICALVISLIHYGIADGISYWVGVLSFAAVFVLAMLSYFAQHFKLVLLVLVMITVLALILLIM